MGSPQHPGGWRVRPLRRSLLTMATPRLLYGDAPEPTGETRQWMIEADQLTEVLMLLGKIRQYQAWGDTDEVANLREHLMSMPGFPGGNIGDHYEIRVRPRMVSSVPRLATS